MVFFQVNHIEDINTHLKDYLTTIPKNNVQNHETVLRGITELSTETLLINQTLKDNIHLNINKRLNKLNIRSLNLTKQLKRGEFHELDYDNKILANNKYGSKPTYKKNMGYFQGIVTIGDKVNYVENRYGNANVKSKLAETLKNAYELLLKEQIKVNCSRMGAGS